MATNITIELKEDTRCAICMERFKDPRMLPCVHTFCMGCLDNCERNLHGGKFTCPSCRRVVDIPDGVRGLPKNFYIVNLMEKLELAESISDSAKCQFCRAESGVLICLDCKCHLCRTCKDVHDRLPGSLDHTVAETDKLTDDQYMSKLLKNKPPCCDKHPKEKLRFFCRGCSVLICRDCTLLIHKSHVYVEAADGMGVVTYKLEFLLDGSRRRRMGIEQEQQRMELLAGKTRTKASECSSEIEEHYSAFVAKLKSDKDTLLNEVDRIRGERCALLDRKVTEMTNQLKAYGDNENMTRQILDGKNQWEILGMQSHLKNAFDKLELENGAAVSLGSGGSDSSRPFRFAIKELPTRERRGTKQLKTNTPPQSWLDEVGERNLLGELELQDDELKRSKNAWKLAEQKDVDADAELLKRFKGILNKLTPQNFAKMMAQTMVLPINTEERLKGIIDLVFEKAIMEPQFSQAYANMCRVMHGIGVKNAQGETTRFRTLIIIRCQKQFEKQRDDEQLEKERHRIAELTTEKERAEALERMEYQQMIAKIQIVGCMRFIGELFKLQLLTEKIMLGCISLLLKAKDEESLECMSKLVTTIGQSLDHPKGKTLMDHFFSLVDTIVEEKKVSHRIRFMLQDLRDLRSNNWVPRRNEEKPMTIDQLRKDAKKKKRREQRERMVADQTECHGEPI